MRTYFNYILALGLVLLSLNVFGQTADKDRGCIGLEVQFSGPSLSSYYWDFKDGANSTLQNPVHQYVTPGVYNVTLQEGQGGATVGTVTITIFEKPQATITATPDAGCVPLDVSFTSTVTIDPGLQLTDIVWTFGDGATGNGDNVMHTYTLPNFYDIFLKLETGITNCDVILEFNDQVKAEAAEAKMSIPNGVVCDYPADVQFVNQSSQDAGNMYEWDFGNGRTSTDRDPGLITYTNRGIYEATLIVTTSRGCTDTTSQQIIIGEPIIDVTLPDTLCVNEEYTIKNNTVAEAFDWRYGSPSIRSFKEEPTIVYDQGGYYDIRLKASNSLTCFKDTMISIFVEEPDVDFQMDPAEFCKDNLPKTFIANNTNHQYYIWNNDLDTLNTSPTYTVPGFPDRDSLFINLPDSITGTLRAVSKSGCVNSLTKSFPYELAEAYFIPDQVIGINSLLVEFTDHSNSENDIVRRFWSYGDGTTQTLGQYDTIHTHLYQTCGLHHAKLLVEDSKGCIDVSKAVEIFVLCVTEVTGEPAECNANTGINCAGGILNATFSPPVIDWHVNSDDNRFNLCWTDDVVSYQYNYPGTFPFIAVAEYQGVVIDTVLVAQINIDGTKPIIDYTRECSDPFTVDFSSNSINADNHTWTYNGQVISTATNFSYTFPSLGDHEVFLETSDNTSGCPPVTTSQMIHVTVPIADFEIPDKMCDNIAYKLDAKASKDVFNSCYKGYLWEFEKQRPRETGKEELPHTFASGYQEVTLIVEDINGCKDTTSRFTDVYGIEPMTNFDSITCLPYPKQFMDLSTSDTTLVAWDWSFGSQDQNPFYEFDTLDLHPSATDSILINFAMEDAFGCRDSISHWVSIQEPNFFINSDPGTRACAGDPVIFTVIDTAGIKDDYEFTWQFGDEGTAVGDTVSFAFSEEGRVDITMSFQNRNGNCAGIVDKIMIISPQPSAEFTSDIDGVDVVCYPKQIEFESDSDQITGGLTYQWTVGDELLSELADPTIGLGNGEHQVTLLVTNTLGCTDSITHTYTLVGPTADFEADKDVLCIDDEITITVSNLENVSDYSIDFGDGSPLVENQPSVVHTYTEYPTVISLYASSDDLGCEVTDTLPITISGVQAYFEFECGGTIINNLSLEGAEFLWDFGDGLTSTEFNPEYPYDQLDGQTNVKLTVIDSSGNCISFFETNVASSPQFEMANLFSPNGDGHNDTFMPVNVKSATGDITIRTFRIFNRWGQQVYDNTNPDGWTGIFDGKEAPPEVYAYYIELEIPGCGDAIQKGNVTLIR